MITQIITNKIMCRHCKDILTSTNDHMRKTCRCGRVTIDGGLKYLRRDFKLPDDFIDLSLTREHIESLPFNAKKEM